MLEALQESDNQRKKAAEERERLIAELQDAMGKVLG